MNEESFVLYEIVVNILDGLVDGSLQNIKYESAEVQDCCEEKLPRKT